MSRGNTYLFIVEHVNIFCQDFVDRVGFFERNETETSGKRRIPSADQRVLRPTSNAL